MTLPYFILYQKLNIPEIINCWFNNYENNKINLVCNTVEQPLITIEKDKINISSGRWIFRKGNVLISIDQDGKEKVIRDDSNNYVIDYISLGDNEIYPIYLKNKKYLFSGNEYEKYVVYLDKKILIDRNKINIFLRNKTIELEKGKQYYLSKNYISIVYEEGTKVIDNAGNVLNFKIQGKYLGFNEIYGDIFKTEQGVIFSSRKGVIGICVDESYLIGEMQGGLVILCGDKLKYYYNTGWREIERHVESELSVNLSNNLLGILRSNNELHIYDINFNELIKFENVYSFILDYKRFYLLSNDKVIAIGFPVENYNPIKIINNNNTVKSPITLQIDETYLYNLTVEKGKVIEIKELENRSKLVLIEPYEFKKGSLNIMIGNKYFKLIQNIPYESEVSNIEFKDLRLLVSNNNGRVIGHVDKNGLLLGTIKYRIPTRSPIEFSIIIYDNIYKYEVTDNNSDIILNIPLKLSKTIIGKIPMKLEVYINQRMIESLEYLVPVITVNNNEKCNTIKRKIINNSSIREIITKRNNIFEWEDIFEYPGEYQGILVAREGDIIEIEGEKIKINKGFNLIKITKSENYSREYVILGVENPIKEVYIEYKAKLVNIKLNIDNNVPFEVFYGPHSYRGISRGVNEISLPIEPTYNLIKVRAIAHGFKWEVNYTFNSLYYSLLIAKNHAELLKRSLLSFGIV